MIKTILLALDLTVFSSYLLQHGVELAKKHDAKLVIVHAVEPLGVLGQALISTYIDPDASREITTKGVESMVCEVKAQVVDTLSDQFVEGEVDLLKLGEVIVKLGVPEEIILQALEDIKADLVILGSNSPSTEAPASLGRVSQKVLSRSKVPVYIIPNPPVSWQQKEDQSQLGLW